MVQRTFNGTATESFDQVTLYQHQRQQQQLTTTYLYSSLLTQHRRGLYAQTQRLDPSYDGRLVLQAGRPFQEEIFESALVSATISPQAD
jgi:hypothetical protein